MKIVVGGQIDKQKVYDTIKGAVGDRPSAEIKDDIAAPVAAKPGRADNSFGACKTGGGGALAMAIALLGMNQCATVSMPGKMLSEDEILAQVKAGKKAYGFTDQHIEKVVPIILKGLGF